MVKISGVAQDGSLISVSFTSDWQTIKNMSARSELIEDSMPQGLAFASPEKGIHVSNHN